MNTSKATLIISNIIGKMCSIVGCVIVILFGLPFITASYEGLSTYIIALVFMLVGVLLIILGTKAKHRIKRFKKYVFLISTQQMMSLHSLASATSQSVDFVKTDLQHMINRHFFVNAAIDSNAGEIVIGHATQAQPQGNAVTPNSHPVETAMETVICPGCGATGFRQKGTIGNCEYCGTILK